MIKNYRCKRCDKRFISEELVKSHLQWAHDIPPRALIEGINKLKQEGLGQFFK